MTSHVEDPDTPELQILPSEVEASLFDEFFEQTRPQNWKDAGPNMRTYFSLGHGSTKIDAVMETTAKNIPRLMRQGFEWSKENVERSHGFFEFDIPFPKDCRHHRVYKLRDLKHDPDWIATLKIIALDPSALSGFDIDCLKDHVQSGMAWNWQGKVVYYCDFPSGVFKFDSIYDDGVIPFEDLWSPQAIESFKKYVCGGDFRNDILRGDCPEGLDKKFQTECVVESKSNFTGECEERQCGGSDTSLGDGRRSSRASSAASSKWSKLSSKS